MITASAAVLARPYLKYRTIQRVHHCRSAVALVNGPSLACLKEKCLVSLSAPIAWQFVVRLPLLARSYKQAACDMRAKLLHQRRQVHMCQPLHSPKAHTTWARYEAHLQQQHPAQEHPCSRTMQRLQQGLAQQKCMRRLHLSSAQMEPWDPLLLVLAVPKHSSSSSSRSRVQCQIHRQQS